MNIGMVTSYIIAGMLLLGIAMMNINVQSSTAELTISQMVREHMVNITEILNDDVPNMGYHVDRTTADVSSTGNRILLEADSSKISFYRNLTDDASRTPDLITWELKQDTVFTGNPGIKTLTRSVQFQSTGAPDENDIQLGVTRFQIRYYDTVGEPLGNNMPTPLTAAQLQDVEQIYIVMEVQSREPVLQRATGDGRFVRTVWEKRFTPMNLQ